MLKKAWFDGVEDRRQGTLLGLANRGFEADTNGAIVGALLGARWGYDGLPRSWVEAVLQANPREPWHQSGPYRPCLLFHAPATGMPGVGIIGIMRSLS